VNKAEQHLSEVGYWAGPAADKAADRARCAILAFQRVERRHQTGKLDATDVQAALEAARPIPRETGYSHVEVDLQRQVLFVVDQNIGVRLVVPISSGSGKLYTFEGKTSRAVTPRGRFTVYRKVAGWRKAPLGMIYYPNYFNDGWAIHGSASVPNYPASHGCIRIPIATAKELSEMTPLGTVVLVYDQ
jgi:lipoprotein-anchoring transpeptidase ErfK/SrfK